MISDTQQEAGPVRCQNREFFLRKKLFQDVLRKANTWKFFFLKLFFVSGKVKKYNSVKKNLRKQMKNLKINNE